MHLSFLLCAREINVLRRVRLSEKESKRLTESGGCRGGRMVTSGTWEREGGHMGVKGLDARWGGHGVLVMTNMQWGMT